MCRAINISVSNVRGQYATERQMRTLVVAFLLVFAVVVTFAYASTDCYLEPRHHLCNRFGDDNDQWPTAARDSSIIYARGVQHTAERDIVIVAIALATVALAIAVIVSYARVSRASTMLQQVNRYDVPAPTIAQATIPAASRPATYDGLAQRMQLNGTSWWPTDNSSAYTTR